MSGPRGHTVPSRSPFAWLSAPLIGFVGESQFCHIANSAHSVRLSVALATWLCNELPVGKPNSLLPDGADKAQLKLHAEKSFEAIMGTFRHPEEVLIRALWDAEAYLNRWPFRDVKPPIDLEYGLLLVEVFMPHHVLELLEILRIREDSRAN